MMVKLIWKFYFTARNDYGRRVFEGISQYAVLPKA
jgi:hypothetical protein